MRPHPAVLWSKALDTNRKTALSRMQLSVFYEEKHQNLSKLQVFECVHFVISVETAEIFY